VALNQRTAPADFDAYAFKLQVIAALEAMR